MRVHYPASGQSNAFSDQQKRWTGYSTIILGSQLHKNRGTVFPAEWPFSSFPILLLGGEDNSLRDTRMSAIVQEEAVERDFCDT